MVSRRAGMRSTRAVLAVLLAGQIIVGLATLSASGHRPDDDVNRFFEIATSEGQPYRDFPVEYTPLQTFLVERLAGATAEDTYRHVVVFTLLLHVATVATILWGWGTREAEGYLLLCTPLLSFLFLRVDLLSVLAATCGMAFLARGLGASAGASLAIGAFAKLWPLAIAPALLRARSRAGILSFATVSAVGGLMWLVYAGPGSFEQISTFRGSSGWQFESLIGSILWAAGGELRWERGALRVGTVPGLAYPLLVGIAIVILVSVWRRQDRPALDPAGAPSLVSVATVVTISPIFSLQYAIWLVPWTAITLAGGPRVRRYAALGTIAIVATGLLALAYVDVISGSWAVPATKAVLLLRNASCVALIVTWFSGRSSEPDTPAARA